jgi:RNA polymerase sigma-70 factor (ECF subfamily)
MHELAGPAFVTAEAPADPAAEFEERLPESSTLAFRVAYGVLRQRQDAEDVAQEALVRAYRNLAGLRDRERFRAWLVRIAWRLALDHRRSSRRRERREQLTLTLEKPENAEDIAVKSEFRERLWAAIDTLPQDLRVAIVLAGIQGHNTREIAALLELPEGTVKSRLFVARKRLAEKLR